MSNLDRALKWASLGQPVFPCHEMDWINPANGRLHQFKSPRTDEGFKEATTLESVIRTWWTEYPDHLVGVVMNELVVLDIDMSMEKGKDGWSELFENDLEPPATFSVTTHSGGNHYFYRQPEGLNLSPTVGLRIGEFVKLGDVDRRAGNSYVIAWSDRVPPSLDELSIAPDWLCHQNPVLSLRNFVGTVQEWFANLPSGSASAPIVNAIGGFPSGDFNRQVMLAKQLHLVFLGRDGERGVAQALKALRELWLAGNWNQPKYELDWNRGLAGAIFKFGGYPQPDQGIDDGIDLKAIRARAIQFRIDELAKQLLASESFAGSEVIEWGELETLANDYLVEDLVPNSAMVFLIGKPNVGKTFAYISMACCIVTGRPWLGKPTRPAKIGIVLGEGRSGFSDRVAAWCDHHEVPRESVIKELTFIDGANLSAPASVDRIRSVVADRGIELLIFDTWSATSGALDENASAEVSRLLKNAEGIAPNLSTMFVHHPRKESSSGSKSPILRGSSALMGRADVVMSLIPQDYRSTSEAKRNWLAISTEPADGGKSRDAAPQKLKGAFLDVSHGPVPVFNWDRSAELTVHLARLSKMHEDVITVNLFANRIEVSEDTARRSLDALVNSGHLVKLPRVGREFRWARKGFQNSGSDGASPSDVAAETILEE